MATQQQIVRPLLLKEALEWLRQGRIKPHELFEQTYQHAKKMQPMTNAFLTFSPSSHSSPSHEKEKERGEPKCHSLLKDIPIAIKDIFCTSGLRTTAGSLILSDFVPNYSATVVENLTKRHGANVIGKTSLDEFAMGSANLHIPAELVEGGGGPTINPWSSSGDPRVTGGSSGGSAVAVASHSCFAALGSDTGGSVRLPAAFCGVVGMKATYGLASRYGMIAYASSLDTPGVFARSVQDTAFVLESICGHEPRDSTSLPIPFHQMAFSKTLEERMFSKDASSKRLTGVRVGIPKQYRVEGLSAEILKFWEKGIQSLIEEGAQIQEVDLPTTEYALPAYYIIACAEASSNLARYDGIKYGLRYSSATNLEELYFKTRSEGFGKEVQRRMLMGAFCLSRKSYESFYLKAQQIRRLVKDDFDRVFRTHKTLSSSSFSSSSSSLGVDVLLTPTSPSVAFRLPSSTSSSFSSSAAGLSPLEEYMNDVMTIPASLAGLPAISVPVAFSEKEKLPIGLQIIGPQLCEIDVLTVAQAIEDGGVFSVREGATKRPLPPIVRF